MDDTIREDTADEEVVIGWDNDVEDDTGAIDDEDVGSGGNREE